jgi:hypothetical protein
MHSVTDRVGISRKSQKTHVLLTFPVISRENPLPAIPVLELVTLGRHHQGKRAPSEKPKDNFPSR